MTAPLKIHENIFYSMILQSPNILQIILSLNELQKHLTRYTINHMINDTNVLIWLET